MKYANRAELPDEIFKRYHAMLPDDRECNEGEDISDSSTVGVI
ncbi:MAG: hypothetical protein PHH84_09165 [Oscillospiraceae bacterium]|nr:hypothetical protein [Oscillospiraceae bacterium]MDD4414532.1 hypothetical protein [Oscillospiraceae bacterium]